MVGIKNVVAKLTVLHDFKQSKSTDKRRTTILLQGIHFKFNWDKKIKGVGDCELVEVIVFAKQSL